MFNKKDILNGLKSVKTDNGPKDSKKLEKEVLVTDMKKKFQPSTDGKSDFLKKEHINPDLANVLKGQDTWKPKTNVKEISKKFQFEAVSAPKQNAFRFNIEALVLDKMHSKFKITRGPEKAVVELLYPNANGKITVKIVMVGSEDNVVEVGLEDEQYTKNFGFFILGLIDGMIKQKLSTGASAQDLSAVDGVVGKTYTANPGISGFGPMWENALSLVEANDPTEEDVDSMNEKDEADLGMDPAAMSGADASADISSEEGEDFGRDDFSMGNGTEIGGFTSDFGGDIGGGATGGSSGDAGAVNADDAGTQGGTDGKSTEFVNFRDKTDWTNDSLNGMQKLVAEDTAKKMQQGSGVVLSQEEIINGTTGIKGDTNYDIIDKFLKTYPELDNMDIPKELMDQLEDKLALGDNQFDSWLQAKLPELSGTEVVDETLNNDMFDNFEEMGGENPTQAAPNEEEGLSDFLSSLQTSQDQDESLRNSAEIEVGQQKANEFPNLGGDAEPEVDEEPTEEFPKK